MKKVICVCIAVFMLLLCSCGTAQNEEPAQEQPVEEEIVTIETANAVQDYVKKLPTNEDREEFLAFKNYINSYHMAIHVAMENIGNTERYEFNPTKAEEIPAELQGVFDFPQINLFPGIEDHKDVSVVIDGEKVEVKIGDMTIAPSSVGYMDIQEYVEKYNVG